MTHTSARDAAESDPTALSRALEVIDALPIGFKPSDAVPLREALPGVWPTIGDLRAALAHPAVAVPDDVRRLSEAASKGEWYTDSEKCDGSYGSGEDCHEGYLAYSIVTDAEMRHGNPGVILESSNSTVGEIHEEWNEDDFTAWDETAKNNTAFIAAAVNFVRDLIRREADNA